MTKISEILCLDLREDIKNVIDLEDRSEIEIQQEIESYIVTEGVGRHISKFTNQFTSNIKETGVWVSGFYGSGKSYFGKMLGHIINNPVINGTAARERFIPRLKGVANESLIENEIRKLDSIDSRVIFLDVAKQNTENGLAFTLFANFLKCLGFRDDIYGYMEFDLQLDGKYDEFLNKAKELEHKEWSELKVSNRLVAKAMRNIFLGMGYTNEEYNDTQKVYSDAISNFSANKFKDELDKYLTINKSETLVFIFDEASEAVSQKKFTLLDLEGISEALSSISSKVWTIAIAQEKLDDVINNANVNKSQLTKVTDRFKTKIHLESTEVDVIIRSRLLQKKHKYQQQLIEYYKANEGLVADATNLKSSFPTKTTTAEEFAVYYPFHKYQFAILQKFLFSSNALVATQIAARGMIITTFDVLRKQLRNETLFNFATAPVICSEAQNAPPTSLNSKYDTAGKILANVNSAIDGEKLLKTIHLLSDSALVAPNIENITKTYIPELKDYYDTKPKIAEGLNILVEEKVLLLTNNSYKITSDQERKLLDEMKGFDVELFVKKRELVSYIKKSGLFNPVATFTDSTESFKFNVLTDLDDEICASNNKHLKIVVYSLFNITENRQDFIESIKLETQYSKDLISLIPDNRDFTQIDKLIAEVKRYGYMEEKYGNDTDQDKRRIVREFSAIKDEKEKDLRVKIEDAYSNASLIYMFDEHLLNRDAFKGTISEVQRKLIKLIYFKRLTTQLSESLALKIFKDRKEHLHRLFSGADFKFFDANGNFTGDHLKVVEELTSKIKNKFIDGRSLEMELSGPPWGYTFGTIVSTLAALFRAGRLTVKHNGEPYFSCENKAVHEAFGSGGRFKAASFKSINVTLTAAQKNDTVQLLMDLDAASHIGRKVDWNTNDFELADSIKLLADHFLGALVYFNDNVPDFDNLFPVVASQKAVLQNYSGKTTENNYIDKVEYLLNNKDEYITAIKTISKAQKFIKKNLTKVKYFKIFIAQVVTELKKAEKSDDSVQENHEQFNSLYKQDMVKNFAELRRIAQAVKDAYFKLISNANSVMGANYQALQHKVDAAQRELEKNYPADLNRHNIQKLQKLKTYCAARIIKDLILDYSITCPECGFSLSDMMNYTALAPSKESELLVIQSSFVAQPPPEPKPGEPDTPKKEPIKISLAIKNSIMSVQEYKSLLTTQLSNLAAASPNEEIEIIIKN